jgi:hypothetical protein
MKTTSIIASIGFLASAVLAAPATAQTELVARSDAPESIIKANNLGIDIFGPIPSDAVKVEEGHYIAEEGTLAHAWIKAQLDVDLTKVSKERRDEITKREFANIGIGMFAQDWCKSLPKNY